MAVAAAILIAAALLSFRQVYEPDLWWHLAQGRENASGSLVRSNLFSFIYPEYRQHYTSWLFDTGAFLKWQLAGGAGVQTLQFLALSATFWVLYLAGRREAPATAVASILALTWVVLEPRAIPRPHLVSFVGLAASTLLVHRAAAEQSSRPLRWAIPLVAVWANFHVESLFGAALVGAFAVSECVWPRSLTRRDALRALSYAAGCVLATLATPYGWGVWQYLFENTAVPGLLAIAELQPPYLPAYRAFYVYLGLGALLLVSQPRRLRLWELVAAVAFAAAGLRYLRLTPLVVLATAPMLASRLGALMARGLSGWAALVTAVAAAILLARLPPRAFLTELAVGTDAVQMPGFFSASAAGFARTQGLRGPVFNSANLGGFVAFQLYPDVKTFQDSRLQAYPPDHFAAIVQASASQADWDALVAGVDWAIVSRPWANALSGVGRFPRAEWPLVYWDNATEIVVRRDGRYAAVAAAHEYLLLTPDADPAELSSFLDSPLADRLRAEARRQRFDNPRGFLAASILCVDQDPDACAALAAMRRVDPVPEMDTTDVPAVVR